MPNRNTLICALLLIACVLFNASARAQSENGQMDLFGHESPQSIERVRLAIARRMVPESLREAAGKMHPGTEFEYRSLKAAEVFMREGGLTYEKGADLLKTVNEETLRRGGLSVMMSGRIYANVAAGVSIKTTNQAQGPYSRLIVEIFEPVETPPAQHLARAKEIGQRIVAALPAGEIVLSRDVPYVEQYAPNGGLPAVQSVQIDLFVRISTEGEQVAERLAEILAKVHGDLTGNPTPNKTATPVAVAIRSCEQVFRGL